MFLNMLRKNNEKWLMFNLERLYEKKISTIFTGFLEDFRRIFTGFLEDFHRILGQNVKMLLQVVYGT